MKKGICLCEEKDRRIIIDCTVNPTYPRPERHSTQFKDLQRHWTISQYYYDKRRDLALVVNFLTCSECYKKVIQ